jgi:anti-anti-sigma regulatory factor
MATKERVRTPQRSGPIELGYRLSSNAERADITPVSARTPWWTHVDTWPCDDGMEPILEIWLDDRSAPAIIRMAGVLDQRTKRSLLSLVDHLFAQGARHFLVDAGDLEIGDASGANELTMLQRRTREAGGSVTWEGVDFGQPRRCGLGEVINPRLSARSGESRLIAVDLH